jgi:hypothetical protein
MEFQKKESKRKRLMNYFKRPGILELALPKESMNNQDFDNMIKELASKGIELLIFAGYDYHRCIKQNGKTHELNIKKIVLNYDSFHMCCIGYYGVRNFRVAEYDPQKVSGSESGIEWVKIPKCGFRMSKKREIKVLYSD